MVLFSSIFVFVNRFPTPAPQNANAFQASVVMSGGYVSGVQILLESGPVVQTWARVYLQSSTSSSDWQFHQANGIPVGWGLTPPNATTGWTMGKTWSTQFKSPGLPASTNLSVYVISASQLLYSTVITGSPLAPPVLASTWTSPAFPSVGSNFSIYAQVSGSSTGMGLNVSLQGVPGLPSTAKWMKPLGGGKWVYNVAAGLTTGTGGTYAAFVQGKNNATGVTVAGSVTITLTPGITVSVGLSQPPPYPPSSQGNLLLSATITYFGAKQNVPVSVSFTITQVVLGHIAKSPPPTTIPGATGATISGPGSLTVYAQSVFSGTNWVLGARVTITASVTLTNVGSQKATAVFLENLVPGIVYTTTSSSGQLANLVRSFPHTCPSSGSGCPYLYIDVWDNYTTAMLGPSSLSFSGKVATNASCTGCQQTYTISANTVSAGSSKLVQVVAGLWTPPGGSSLVKGVVFTLSVWLTLTSASPLVTAYVYDTFTVTLT